VSDVLVVSMSGEKERVAPLVKGLKAAGLSVWWDGDLAAGEHRQQSIAAELAVARCVVVVWTTASVGPAGEVVQDVAARAKARGILLPVRLDRVTEPLGFGQIQSLDLVRWNGRPRNRRFQEVAAAARTIVSGKTLPPGQRTGRLLRRLAGGTIFVTVFLALLSFFSDVQSILAPVCRVAGVRTVCSRWGLGGVPTPAEETAWVARVPGDCTALRAYLSRFPNGAYAEEAGRKLLAAETAVTERWRAAEEQRPQLRVRPTFDPLASEKAARADALARAAADAEELACAGYKAGLFRLLDVAVEVRNWDCSPRHGGFVCGFDGLAVCRVQARTLERREICR
jgi:hypothetical protein